METILIKGNFNWFSLSCKDIVELTIGEARRPITGHYSKILLLLSSVSVNKYKPKA